MGIDDLRIRRWGFREVRHGEINYKTSVIHFRLGKNRKAHYDARAKGAQSKRLHWEKGEKRKPEIQPGRDGQQPRDSGATERESEG